MEEKVILVTGFGPFGVHEINASWEAVKLLEDQEIDEYKIKTHLVPVTYKYVDENIPALWEKYNPQLVIHVGVSNFASKITIEKRAYRFGYQRKDCENMCHPTGVIDGNKDCIFTEIDVGLIYKDLKCEDIKFCNSTDAGRYLCEYIYYKSLQVDPKKTLFIHVPTLGKPYNAEELADGLCKIIRCALKQIEKQPTSVALKGT